MTMEAGAVNGPSLSTVVIPLLKGVLYRDANPAQWSALLQLQNRVRDYVAVLGLALMLDEAEGYAFLRSAPESPKGEDGEDASILPRLVARRPLSYPVSLLLALLRKKLAEFDAGGHETGLVLSRDEMIDMVRVFMAEGVNESRIVDQWSAHINKVVDMGFLRPLKGQADAFEVLRILKAFVDAQWLADFEARLDGYRAPAAAKTQAADE
jgi:hypothetical protein